MENRPDRVAEKRAVKITRFSLLMSLLFLAPLVFPAARIKPAKITKMGEAIMLSGVKLTPFVNDNDSLGSVDIDGTRIVITLQFNERNVTARPYYSFRLDSVPEKSDIILLVGSAKVAPRALRKSFEDMAPLTLAQLPQASTGYRFLMFMGPPVFSISFLFDVPKDSLAEEKVFSARFKIGPKEHAILVSLEK
jgi:hypothetical protein